MRFASVKEGAALLAREDEFTRALSRFDLQARLKTRQDVTAKDLTEEDRRRLNGGVERILQKDAPTRDEMLREVSATLARCVGQRRVRRAAGQHG